MSESDTIPQDHLIEDASSAVPAPSQTAAPTVGTAEHGIVSAPVLALPAEAHMLLELIGRGLAPEADAATRDAARELWARFTQMLATAAPGMSIASMMPVAPMMPVTPAPAIPTGPTMPTGPAMPTGPTMPTAPAMPTAPPMPTAPAIPTAPAMPTAPPMPTAPAMPTVPVPTSPIAMAGRMLRQLPPDQLLDLALQRLRAALPAGATVPSPKGIQFQLVPVTPPPGSR